MKASLGLQRGVSFSSRGIALLLPPGLDKYVHIAQATELPSVFSTMIDLDDDLKFAARVVVTFGEAAEVWRRRQRRAWQTVQEALGPLDVIFVALQPVSVHHVSHMRRPATMACATAILRWPDRTQPG